MTDTLTYVASSRSLGKNITSRFTKGKKITFKKPQLVLDQYKTTENKQIKEMK
jgi:hypothetical protein